MWWRVFVSVEICMLTTSVYIGASLWSSSAEGAMEVFSVSQPVAALGMAMQLLIRVDCD